MNVLFVCTENRARSPLAETLFRRLQGPDGPHQTRAVGATWHAPQRLTTRDIAWADRVAVMEAQHLAVIRRYWPRHTGKVVVLDVADPFGREDAALHAVLEPKVRALLEELPTRPATGAETLHRAGAPAAVKRAFDVLVSGLGLLASAPLWALIACLIKREDGGPVFYAQERVGKDGRRFTGRKFRSMVPDAERTSGPLQARDADARITRVGRWLRVTAMDELPQLWTIFRGDMSFVGPRALRAEEIEVNSQGRAVPLEAIPGYAARQRVTPGLTGLAQIYADRDIPRRHKFRYDRVYIRKQSFGLDLRLILLSLWITLRGRWERRGAKF
jgi:lipopolysaccharide/colanic/teichoic acid biosynthesis glycosyltransferase/predicted protein tyrosine phosphatase